MALTACPGPTAIDARMKPMIGVSEETLIARKGRAPDASLQPEPDVGILSWHHAMSFAVPNALLFYQYSGNAVRPIAYSSTGIVIEICVTEWTVGHGVATGYRWSGAGCTGSP